MAYTLKLPHDQILPEGALFFRTHVGHRENAVNLAVGLIRKAAAQEKSGFGDDPLLHELGGIAKNWAVYTLLQGCYVREYHEWERAVKRYFANQWDWNCIPERFNWSLRGKSIVTRTVDALAVFSVSMDQIVIDSIDGVRDRVNNIKHDPLDHEVEQSDYDNAVKVFAAFWDKMMNLEGMIA
jgi:hypothetical protein